MAVLDQFEAAIFFDSLGKSITEFDKKGLDLNMH